MTKWKIYNQDVIEWAKSYNKGKFHALLTDAPYHLTSIVKRFGKNGSAPAQFGTDGVFSRSSAGFMGQEWDGGDIAFRPETWAAFGEHLYPGSFGMAFSASRNWHRMAVAIEDAGFILHPTIFFLWVQGQGFPKATKVKADGFEGRKYGLQALKPSVEPIIMFQKPYEGRPIDNIAQTGAGTLNIDGTRIPLEGGDEYVINEFEDGMKPFGNGAGHSYKSKKVTPSRHHNGKVYNGVADGYKRPGASMYQHKTDWEMQDGGRYPANLILDEESARRLDQQTGVLKSGKMLPEHSRHTDESPHGIYGKFDIDHPLQETIGDSGGASRFFFRVQEQIDEADPFYYHAKVNPKERNAGLDEKNPHPTLKPIGLMKYLATLLLPPAEYTPRRILVPFSGVSSEMIGAGLAGWEHVVGIEFKEDYVNIGKKRLEYWLNDHN